MPTTLLKTEQPETPSPDPIVLSCPSKLQIHIEKLGLKYEAIWINHADFEFPKLAKTEKFLGVDTETPEIVYDGTPLVGVVLQVCFPRCKTVHVVPFWMWDHYLERLEALYGDDIELIFHNAAFDLKVLNFTQRPWIWRLFNKRKCKDTMVRFVQKMQAAGEFFPSLKLKDISKHLLGIDLSKDDAVRLTHTRTMVFTEGHFRYDATDPIATALVWQKLGKVLPERGEECEHVALCGAVALESVRDNGMVVDYQEYTRMRRLLVQNVDEYARYLAHWGVEEGVAGNKKSLQTIFAHLEKKLGIRLPRTDKSGEIKMNDLVISKLPPEKQHPFFENWCRFVGARQILSHFFKDDIEAAGWLDGPDVKLDEIQIVNKEQELSLGLTDEKVVAENFLFKDDDYDAGEVMIDNDSDKEIVIPIKIHVDGRIHPRFQWATATGRTQCSGPNAQNFPRKCELYWCENGEWKVMKLSVRGYIIPTPGSALNSTDFNQLELCGLGEDCKVMFGESVMADLINSGIDLHTWFGEEICKSEGKNWKLLTSDEKKEFRGFAKVCNFGIPGGLGPEKLVEFALKSYGIRLTIDQAKKLKKLWLDSFPEMKKFFRLELDPEGSKRSLDAKVAELALDDMGIRTQEDLENAIYMSEMQRARKLNEAGKETEARKIAERARQRAKDDSFGLARYVCRTFTGRVARNKLFNACANMRFQGACADAAKLGLYNLWRHGFRVVDFIHDPNITARCIFIVEVMYEQLQSLHVHEQGRSTSVRRCYKAVYGKAC